MTPHERRWISLKYEVVGEFSRQAALINGLISEYRSLPHVDYFWPLMSVS